MNPGGNISPGGLTSFVFPYLGNSLPEKGCRKKESYPARKTWALYHIYGKENRNIYWACPGRDH